MRIFMAALRRLVLGVLLAGATTAAAWAQDAYTNSEANVRSGPGTHYPIIGGLPAGTPVDIVDDAGGWRRVRADGLDGWVAGSLLDEEGAPPPVYRPAPPIYRPAPPVYVPGPIYRPRPPGWDRPRPPGGPGWGGRPPGGWNPPGPGPRPPVVRPPRPPGGGWNPPAPGPRPPMVRPPMPGPRPGPGPRRQGNTPGVGVPDSGSR